MAHPCGHFFQWLQLLGVDKAELSDKVVEVLVAGVDVSLGTQLRDAVKVVDVHVHEHAEEPRQDLLHHLQEVLGERRADVGGEDVLIVDLHLNPVHEQVHVAGG